jgi:hypothetical protein
MPPLPSRILALTLACLPAVALAAADAASFDIGSHRELFVDGALVESLDGGAELRLHHPLPQGVALIHDAPWEGNGSGYHSIFQDGAIYRMYYKGKQQFRVVAAKMVDVQDPAFLCYAESEDGIRWRKPNLGLVEFQGSKANNIVMRSGPMGPINPEASEASVFRDDNPAAPADARYKAFFRSRQPVGLLPFRSPDGLHWYPMSDHPVITHGYFDSENLAFWDPLRREYRAYWRYFSLGSPKTPGSKRSIRTATSKDFLHWEDEADLRYVDSPPEQLYTSQIKPYYRAPQILIGFPTRYVERGRNDEASVGANTGAPAEKTRHWSDSIRALPELPYRTLKAAISEREGTALTDALFMASRDGVLFKRWEESFLPPGIERPGTWDYGNQYIGWQIVETKSALAGAPPEMSLYATERYSTSDLGTVLRRYTLRLDGFVSVQAPMTGGELLTRPLRFAGHRLMLSFGTSVAGTVRVEIQDLSGHPYPGFALQDCAPIFGNTIDRTVTWKNGIDVGPLAGRPVRLRFSLHDADVYAFQFQP